MLILKNSLEMPTSYEQVQMNGTILELVISDHLICLPGLEAMAMHRWTVPKRIILRLNNLWFLSSYTIKSIGYNVHCTL